MSDSRTRTHQETHTHTHTHTHTYTHARATVWEVSAGKKSMALSDRKEHCAESLLKPSSNGFSAVPWMSRNDCIYDSPPPPPKTTANYFLIQINTYCHLCDIWSEIIMVHVSLHSSDEIEYLNVMPPGAQAAAHTKHVHEECVSEYTLSPPTHTHTHTRTHTVCIRLYKLVCL